MGGPGSGRLHRKKRIVEHCEVLDINLFVRDKTLQQNVHRSSSITWSNVSTRKETASIGYTVDTTDMAAPWIQLSYTVTQIKEPIVYRIYLSHTRRWCFLCPLPRHNMPCNTCCSKLYSPPGAYYFACRQCYNLTYRSSQQSHTKYKEFDRMLEQEVEQARQRLLDEIHKPLFGFTR